MGLSIHYQGSLTDYSFVDELTDEVEDICKSLAWKYHLWKKKNYSRDTVHVEKPDFINYKLEDLKGISIFPEECEPVELAFFPSGILCSPIKLMHNDPATNDLMVQVVSTKTQFAGPDIHKAVLNLLRYLQEKYFAEFELSDEGMYWETKDEKILTSQFAKYNFILKTVADALSDLKMVQGETPTSLADRIEELLIKKLGPRE